MNAIQLLIAIARELGTSYEELRGPDRSKSIAIRRAIAMLTIRERTELSFPEIARLFNRQDHTTALLGCRSGLVYRNRYPELAERARRAVQPMLRLA